ncbi:MAG: GNA1162 family protein [bacterium]
MKLFNSYIILLVFTIVLSGCVAPNVNTQDKFLSAAPRSILVVPVVNKSVEVTAADYMLSTVSIPLAERGFYVFPINLVKRVLEDDGLADSSMVHAAPASKLASLFGADAVLYINIERWDAQYMFLTTTVTVALDYEIRDGKTDEVLWQNKAKMVYQPDGGGGGGIGGLIAKVVVAAITKAAPNYMPLAHQANAAALYRYSGPGIPFGPYKIKEKPL